LKIPKGQNLYIEEEQTTQWPIEKVQNKVDNPMAKEKVQNKGQARILVAPLVSSNSF
jgi:hypothetical protein